MSTYPQLPKQYFLLFLFPLPAVKQVPPLSQSLLEGALRNGAFRLLAPENQEIGEKGEKGPEMSTDNPGPSPKSNGRLFVHFKDRMK